MFKLDHLEISGFKSFVDPVSVKFTGNLNAIVGPNGCGKSNVSDAVTWVLGERSAKSLRATRMEDVIFSGSQSRKALGMAEVTLTLQTDPTMPEAEDGKLTIGRRLYRSGDSQYLINGKTARLKDVRDLLMGTGLGLRAYSVIEQGRIDAILSGKPQERRRLLEEAAGITKYKERKRIAELKLEDATANLSRIDDIVSEVERSLRSLKRQANAAQRYGARRAEHDALHEKVLLKRWHSIRSGLEEMEGRIAELTSKEAELAAKLHHFEADQESGRESVDKLAEVCATMRQREAEIIATIEGKQEFIKGARDLLREIGERLESGEKLAAHRGEEIERLRSNREAFEEVRASTSTETDAAAQAVDETNDELASAEEAVRKAEKRLEALRSDLLGSLGEVNSVRNRLHQLNVESEKGSFRSSHLRTELRGRRDALRAAAEAAEAGRSALAETRSSVTDLEKRHVAAAGAALESAERIEELDGTITETRHELTAIEQRRELLVELEQAHEEKRARISRALREAGQGEPAFLGDGLTLPEGWERSVDLYLAEMAEAVVLPAEGDALEVGRVLASGRGTNRVLLPSDDDTAPGAGVEDPAIVSSLAEALDLAPSLAHSLPTAYLVESPADAMRLARSHAGVAFLSQDRLWAQSGMLHIQGETAEPGALARDRELARLTTEREALAATLRQTEADAELERARRLDLEAALTRATEELDAARRTLAVAEARQEDLDATHRRLSIECDTLTSEREEIGRELGRVGGSVEEMRAKLEAAEGHHGELESLLDSAQEAVDEKRAMREEVRTSGASRRGQLDLLRERLESHERGLSRIQRELDGHKAQLESWASEKTALRDRRVELERRMGSAETDLQAALEARAGSKDELQRHEETLRDARSAQLEVDQQVRGHRMELETVRSQLGEIRVSEAGLRQDAEHLKADYHEHFESDLPETFEVPEESLDELEVDLERMKSLLHRMGPINELAAEEFAEQEERHGFLTEQRADVLASVQRLRETIREINETSSERFQKTFEEVNESLGVTFRELFNGGEAEMRLMDEEDLLESGIEIVARPPGKRLQNMMLLSGGEKALTALSLLFALFRTKPSPFCILDEVDAPLDDVNTLRFVHLLKSMTADTQFVVITHNKLTMSAASALYGVTMEERGCSRLVSVELDEIHPQEQAQTA